MAARRYFSIDFPTKPSLRSNGKGKGKPAKDEGGGGVGGLREEESKGTPARTLFFFSFNPEINMHT